MDKGFRIKSIVFMIKFFVIFFVFQGLLAFLGIEFLQQGLAALLSYLTGAEQLGIAVLSNGKAFYISPNCTGLVSGFILASIIFSLKKPELKTKFFTFALGSLSLFIINIARLYIVIYSGIFFGTGIAELFHTLSWFLMSFFIIALWYLLTKKIAGIKNFKQLL